VTLRRSVERVESAVYAVAGMTLLAIVVLMSLRVVSRNLGLGLYGLQLYAQALAVWLTFVVAGNLALDDRHIAIEYVSDRLPDRLVPLPPDHRRGGHRLHLRGHRRRSRDRDGGLLELDLPVGRHPDPDLLCRAGRRDLDARGGLPRPSPRRHR
jgi:hypothetical protein